MDRRDFITKTGASVGAVALTLAGAGNIQAAPQASHAHHKNNNTSLVKSAQECISTAQACLAHCIQVMGTGDTSLKDCAVSVLELESICNTVEHYANYNSKYLNSVLVLAQKVCKDCETECRKHKQHPQCLKCADACTKCSKECDRILS